MFRVLCSVHCRWQQQQVLSGRLLGQHTNLADQRYFGSKTFDGNSKAVASDSRSLLNDTNSKKIKMIRLEMTEHFKTISECEPPEPKQEDWEELLSLPSKRSRKFVYDKMNRKQTAAVFNQIVKQEKLVQNELNRQTAHKRIAKNNHIVYGNGHTALLVRIRPQSMQKWRNQSLMQAKLFNPKVIIDCSYDTYMTSWEADSVAIKVARLQGANRQHPDSFDVHICNAAWNGVTMKCIQKAMPKILSPSHPIEVHTESPIDLFPSDRLVYLTPYAEHDLENVSPDDIYIIGAFVNKRFYKHQKISLAKAQAMGIRVARLPLEKYLVWQPGSSKCFELDRVFRILLELRVSGDWNKALQLVPDWKAEQRDTKVDNRVE